MEDDDRRPSFGVARLVALGGADGVGQRPLVDPSTILPGRERGVPRELRGLAALPAVPAGHAVVDGRAVERLAVLAQVEPALAGAEAL